MSLDECRFQKYCKLVYKIREIDVAPKTGGVNIPNNSKLYDEFTLEFGIYVPSQFFFC